MNRFKKFLLILIFLFPCLSCSSTHKLKIERSKNLDSFIYLNKNDLELTFSLKKDFILVVGQIGCSSCEIIRPKLISYIKEHNIVMYYVDYDNYISYAKNNNLNTSIYSATILMFEKGIYKDSLEYSSSLYFDDNRLNLTLGNKITPSTYYLINSLDPISYDGTKMYQINVSSLNEEELKGVVGTKIVLHYSLNNNQLYSYLDEVNKDIYLYYNNDSMSYLEIINEDNNITTILVNNKEDLIKNI